MKMALAVRRLSHQPQQPPRVIASLRSLRALPPSKALKFRWKGNVDGFVFLSGDTPHAYANRCSHVALELDLNDADFFSHGFIQCKVHGAMFDPESGLCLRPPPQCKRLHPLRRIPLVVEADNVLLSDGHPPAPSQTQIFDDTYLRDKQVQLQAAMDADAMDIQAEVDAINQRSLRLMAAAKRHTKPTK
ncbi:hypothetical protein H257_01189 [Aphanomyces astaci]|uniref:Rieske domain-containing protein n=1 Tax=Aphanomyces astaci TaxID=112090 RepID=W4H8V9_APHAT|nr:hypothetical protein H257_01189 [Aphanomyces astaci]ETV87709.1 hypothetical protein H257_01189 [Aphanomyces astaci]|eukprot:XP_009822572.1 hypothetical protein H257_01189 [Aphanomyces astaci]